MTSRILFLHGFAGGPRSWDRVVSELSPRAVEIVRPALSGHAGQRCSVGSFEQELDRLAGLVEDGEPGFLCGYSLGARLGLGLLQRHPARFRGAVLIGVNPGLESEDERVTRRAADERWCRLLEAEGARAFAEAWSRQDLFASQRTLPPERRAEQQRLRESHDPGELSRALRCLGLAEMPSYWPALGGIGAEVRLLAGESDTKFASTMRRMQQLLPHAHLRLIPGAGHNVVLERPEAVRAAIEVLCHAG